MAGAARDGVGGAPESLLRTLFPPPRYVMPNDAFFEATGVLHVVPGVAAAVYLARMVRGLRG